MRTWDLNAGAAKLELALKVFMASNYDVAEHWSDDTNRAFQATYVRPLDPAMRSLLEALHRLSEVLANAERECDER
jgi:uncharacterized protein YukE